MKLGKKRGEKIDETNHANTIIGRRFEESADDFARAWPTQLRVADLQNRSRSEVKSANRVDMANMILSLHAAQTINGLKSVITFSTELLPKIWTGR
jgi:hypothetical protein